MQAALKKRAETIAETLVESPAPPEAKRPQAVRRVVDALPRIGRTAARWATLGGVYSLALAIAGAGISLPQTEAGNYTRGWLVVLAVAVASAAWWFTHAESRFRAFAFVIAAWALWIIQTAILSPDAAWLGSNRVAQLMGAMSLLGTALAIFWSKQTRAVLWLVWLWSVGCALFWCFAPSEMKIGHVTTIESVEGGAAVWFIILLGYGLAAPYIFGSDDNQNVPRSPGVARSQWADLSGRDFAAVDLDQE